MTLSPAEVLSKARDVLAERGWTQGRFESTDGSLCTLGAIRVAAYGDVLYEQEACEPDTVRAVWDTVQSVIGSLTIAVWNDDPSRTYEDVALALKEAQVLAELASVGDETHGDAT